MPGKYINLLKPLYCGSRASVRTYGESTEEFFTNSGVRQGCPASLFIFNFVIEALLHLASPNNMEQGIELLENRLTSLEYADDIVLLGENRLRCNDS